jgi:hypothetical protein
VVLTLEEAHSTIADPERLIPLVLRECHLLLKNAQELYGLQSPCVAAFLHTLNFMRLDTELNAGRQIDGYLALIDALGQVPSPRVLVILAHGVVLDSPADVTRLARRAEENGIAIYVITPPEEMASAEDRTNTFGNSREGEKTPAAAHRDNEVFLKTGLDKLAQGLHGDFYKAPGTAEPAFDRISDGISGYYRLGVEAPTAPQKRRDVSTKVSVRRGGVSVMSASRAIRSSVPEEVLTPDAKLTRALTVGGHSSSVALELGTSLTRDQSGSQLVLGVDAVLPAATSGPIKASFALINDVDGSERRGLVPIQVPPEGQEYRVAFTTRLATGRYHFRFAVVDGAGRVGAVERTVVARLRQVGSFYACDWILSAARADGPARLLAVDQVPSWAKGLTATLELYRSDPAAPATSNPPLVRLALRRLADDHALTDEDARPVPIAGGFRVGADIPLDSLEPGGYALVATVVEGGNSVGEIRARFRK